MPTPFDPFVQSFPTAELQAEAQKFVDILVNDGTIKNLWHLHATSNHALSNILSAVALSADVHYKEFCINFQGVAVDLWNSSQPANPAEPTPKEQLQLNNIWQNYYGLFSGKRGKIVQTLAEQYQMNTYQASFERFSKIPPHGFDKWVDEQYYQLFAQHYLEKLNLFISSTQHEYRVTGRIVDKAITENGIGNVRVSIKDKNDKYYIRNFGYTYTDRNGYFAFTLILLEEPSGPYNLIVDCEKADLGISNTIDHGFDVLDQTYIDTIEVVLDPVIAQSVAIDDIFNNVSIGLTPSTALKNFLSANNVLTLRNVREMGGLKHQEDIPDPEENSVLVLDALANLELVNDDYAQNHELYTEGITTIVQIANIPSHVFVENHRSTLGDYRAAQLHYTARGTYMATQTVLYGSRDKLNQRSTTGNQDEMACGCKECNSAVGPLAYYTDLLSFTFNNLSDRTPEGIKLIINFPYLENNFHQPFSKLIASCRQLSEEICQNRLATEVLRSYQNDIEAVLPSDQLNNYLEYAYRDLLTQLGTSYEELRMVRNHDEESERLRLANRIGIPLTDPDSGVPDETLQQIFVDLSGGAGQLSEELLESIFGLRDSERTPLTFPEESKVSVWKKAYLRQLWQKQDYPDNPYIKNEIPIIDPDIVTVDDIRLPNSSNVAFQIWDARRTNIEELFPVTGTNYPALLDTLNSLLSRLLDDFEYASPVQDNIPFSAWSETSIGDAITTLSGLHADINSGNNSAVEAGTSELWANYHLKPNELTKIIEIKENYGDDIITEVQAYQDVINIRTQVIKRYIFQEWINEENSNNIILGSHLFWHAQNAPKAGKWPIKNNETPFIDPQLISRSSLTEVTAQHHLLNSAERNLYEARIEQINTERENIRALFDGEGNSGTTANFENMITYAFDEAALTWDPEAGSGSYQELLNKTTDPTLLDEAVATIEDDLKLSLKDFQFILSIGEGVEENQPLDPPVPDAHEPQPLGGFSEADWTRFVDILIHSYKQIRLYAEWIEEEDGEEGELNEPLIYWKIRKAQLPPWRGSTSQRSQWERALTQHSEAPIIDAAMLRPADLMDYTAGFDLLLARHSEMFGSLGWKNQMNTEFNISLAATVEDYRNFLNNRLGLPEVSLESLADMENQGISISKRLAQLGLSSQAYRFLLKIERVLAAAQAITEEEKDQVHYIVMKVLKERKGHIYQLEELDATGGSITHSQDFFRYRKPDSTEYPVQENAPLHPWLASESTRYQWRRKLKSRIEQESSVSDDVKEIGYNTDEKFIHLLRDALIEAVGDSELSLYENARILGDRFLIDLENNCCFKTNRVAMAIEVLQQFHWKTRTGAIEEAYPNVESLADDFDTAWQWMGNYGNWRAAMFVFLYPENLMIPALRKQQTPAFKEVIGATRNNRRFNAEHACKVAKDFQSYIADISNLKIKFSARAIVLTGTSGCNPQLDKYEDLVFIFSVAQNSNSIYYTTVTPFTEISCQQKYYWQKVPIIPQNCTIHGTDLYINKKNNANHLYLFYLNPSQPSKIGFLRFDLNKNSWETEAKELDVLVEDLSLKKSYTSAPSYPPSRAIFDEIHSVNYFSTNIQSLAILQNSPASRRPMLAISLKFNCEKLKSYFTFHRALDNSGLELEEWSWKSESSYTVNNANQDVVKPLNSDLEGIVVDFVLLIKNGSSYWDNVWVLVMNSPTDTDGQRVAVMSRISTGSWDVRHTLGTTLQDITTNLIKHIIFFPGDTISNEEDRMKLHFVRENGAITQLQAIILEDSFGTVGYTYDVQNIEHTFDLVINNITACYIVQSYTSSILGQYNLELADRMHFIHQSNSTNEIYISAFQLNQNGSLTQNSEGFLITPRFNEVINLSNINDNNANLLETYSTNTFFDNINNNTLLIDYVKEFLYFVPLQIALQLTQTGHYLEALSWYRTIYDYTRPIGERKIYYGLIAEENIENIFERTQDWFEDPLNPHTVAGVRQHSYTRYTIMCIVQCLLAYADAEFTSDTSETVPRARELYEQALGLLRLITPQNNCPADDIIASFSESDIDPIWQDAFGEVIAKIPLIEHPSVVAQVLSDIETILQTSATDAEKVAQASTVIEVALATQEPRSFEDIFAELDEKLSANAELATVQPGVNRQLEHVANYGSEQFAQTMQKVTGFDATELQLQTIDWLANPAQPMTEYRGKDTWPMGPSHRSTIDGMSITNPKSAFNLNSPLPGISISGVPLTFCGVTNPMITAMLMHAHVNLFKIRNCMNIAGMVRELSPFAAPTDATSGVPSIGVGGSLSLPTNLSIPPSAYRYRVLIERAKQLVSLAQQMESAFLTALEKFDAESYSILRADQDIESSRANIKLQSLKIKESESNVDLAELQKERSELQVSGLQGMIDEGLLGSEQVILKQLQIGMIASMAATTFGAIGQGSGLAASVSTPWGGIAAGIAASMYLMQSVFQVQAIKANTMVQIAQVLASLERRQQEWEFQKTLAQQDVRIGGQQIKIANDRLRISGQEHEMAQLQNTHAQTSMDFLKNKFTSAELYEFMTRILEDVYEFFLMEATAVAKMAERQLAFERQLELPPFIKGDYWVYEDGSVASGAGESESPDRRGITGSSRLLKDLYDLDQHGFMTNTPRLQITKNISLNQLDPVAMQQFRDTGKMTFYTMQEMFDRDYPGHYLRLIKGVSVSVIALTPPIEGIKATLTNGGISSVITGGNIFQKRVIARQPEQIALSNPAQDNGFLPMQAESEFLHPFEGSGVETLWELRMDKPANPFDFSTIADVIFTIEYEASNSFTYRQTVLNQLNNEPYPGALVLSFKNNLPDQWYELHNPEIGSNEQMKVSFNIGADDLLVHTVTPIIKSVKIFISGEDTGSSGINIGLLTFEPDDDVENIPNEIPTKQYSDTNNLLEYEGLIGKSPLGKWMLIFDNVNQVQSMFGEEEIEDLILVINYEGNSVPYTS